MYITSRVLNLASQNKTISVIYYNVSIISSSYYQLNDNFQNYMYITINTHVT